jgi:hypothetical protein
MTIKAESAWLWIHRILMPVLMAFLTVAFGVGGFIGAKVWDRVEHGLVSLDDRVDAIEVDNARIDGSRFTTQHWTEAKARLDEDRVNLDRRLTRLEESIPQIKETLIRIEKKLDAKYHP